jgi:uncharacterized protein YndB with AHSA1/START domain
VAAEPISVSVLVDADPAEVYEYFTRAEAMVQWMGQNAALDPRVGGEFAVDVNGAAVRGRYLELEPPHRLLISWGFSGSEVLPPGRSIVEVRLRPEAGGTRVEIAHSGLSGPETAEHYNGWRRFLGHLATVASGADAHRGDGA